MFLLMSFITNRERPSERSRVPVIEHRGAGKNKAPQSAWTRIAPMFPIAAHCRRLVAFACCFLLPSVSLAHGGVVEEDDLCVINIGYLKAHFKIYVPQEKGHTEYCEDIPVRGESVFVMEYQHDGLSEAELDFRIIRNVTGKGTFARLEDIEAIDDIEVVTVRYEPPAIVPDVFTMLQAFDEDGEYIGIISAARADSGGVYTAVFPFEVGYTGLGIWPWVIALLLLLQLNYWLMSRRRRVTEAVVMLVAAVVLSPAVLAAEPTWDSAAGYFRVSYTSDLEPVTINTMHGWTLHVETPDGEQLEGVTLTIDGGMPEHNHGLPTAPRVVAELGDGDYRIEGLRFHMSGYWEIRISIDAGDRRDVVTIPLQL